MKEKSLKEKIAAYAAMASAILAAPKQSDAQIMYTNVSPDLVIENGFFNLDLNNDGVVDFKLQSKLYHISPAISSFYSYEIKNTIEPQGNNQIVINNFNGFPQNFSSNSQIGSSQIFGVNSLLRYKNEKWHFSVTTTFNSNLYYWPEAYGTSSGNFLNVDDYVGLKLAVGSNNYYGWARLGISGPNLILKEYGLDTVSNESLFSGEGVVACGINASMNPNGASVFCQGDSISLEINNSSGQNIQWQLNGDDLPGETATNLISYEPGIYTALISNANCSLIIGASVYQYVSFNLFAGVDNEHNSQSDGNIDVTILGNGFPYSYQWSNGATTEDLYSISAGNYQLTVTSSICGDTDTIGVTVNNYSASNIPIANSENTLIQVSCFVAIKNLHIYLPDNSLLGSELDIINELGQCVRTITINSLSQTEDLDTLPAGVYFYRLRSTKKIYTGKFIIAE